MSECKALDSLTNYCVILKRLVLPGDCYLCTPRVILEDRDALQARVKELESAILAKIGWKGLWTFKDTLNGEGWWVAVAFADGATLGDGETGHGPTESDALRELVKKVEARYATIETKESNQ